MLGLRYYPIMLQTVLGCEPAGVVFDDAFSYEVFALLGDVFKSFVVEVKFPLNYILDHLGLRMPWKRNFTGEHNIEHHPNRPNIYFHGVLLKEYLRRDVVWGAIHSVHCRLLGKIFR